MQHCKVRAARSFSFLEIENSVSVEGSKAVNGVNITLALAYVWEGTESESNVMFAK
ncbi:hypothetical protein FACS1894122_12140 [Alphaproteobacteria bacterium]|nr:hypothetical protein FACS1894122_12140 [Alphaproteobacteria bacterium]